MSNLSNSNLFNFAPYGYKLIKQLGSNYSGGRKTYLCFNLTNNEQVVIKLFYFNNGENDWSGFKALEKEVEILKRLNHQRVPQYLDSFETDQGFCLVYRYIKGTPLSSVDLTPEQVHLMAISILEILLYLQSRNVIHRDLKPENIVLGEDGEYYLIDFGFSSIEQNGSIRASSVVAGTMGFMTVEQLFSKSVNQSTDLYALGATLFCKLMRITSNEVGKFIDSRVQLSTSELKTTVSREWLFWLDQLLKNDFRQRTPDAKSALAALLDLSIQPSNTESENIEIFSQSSQKNVLVTFKSFFLIPPLVVMCFVICQVHFKVFLRQPGDPDHFIPFFKQRFSELEKQKIDHQEQKIDHQEQKIDHQEQKIDILKARLAIMEKL